MFRIKYFLLMICFTGLTISMIKAQDTRIFDEEINSIVKKIHQYPQRTKDLDRLKINFDQANSIDQAYINSLLVTGQPGIWIDIYNSYKKLDNRQLLVKTIPAKSIEISGIQLVDYERNLKESMRKACAYYYARGNKMLQSDIQNDVQQSYQDFMQVANLECSYEDLDKLLRKAILKGSTNVEFELNNRTGRQIDAKVVNQLTSVIWSFKKAKYGQDKPAEVNDSFAFIIRINLDEMQIGTDQVKELQYQEERDVYRNDIVVDTIRCLVFETRQLKKAMLSGSLEYIDKQSGHVVNRIPLKVETVFRNSYATLQGDPDAAGDETRKLLQSKKAEYPSGGQLMMDATEEFSRKASEIIIAE